MKIVSYPTGKERQALCNELRNLRGLVTQATWDYIMPDFIDPKHLMARSSDSALRVSRSLDIQVSKVAMPAENILNELVTEQEREGKPFIYADGLWKGAYLGSDLYKATVLETQAKDWMNHDTLSIALAGKIFEDLAFSWVSQFNDSESEVLLSPDRTNDLMQSFYPGAKRKRREFGHDGMYTKRGGISIPDGVLVANSSLDGSKIIAEVEYKMSPTWENLSGKYNSFVQRKTHLKEQYASGAVFAVFVPKGLSNEANRLRLQANKNDLRILAVPVSRSQIGSLVAHTIKIGNKVDEESYLLGPSAETALS